MIADVLIATTAEIRRLTALEDGYIMQQQRLGVTIHADTAARAQIDRVVTEMETLARRLLTDCVGPFIELPR